MIRLTNFLTTTMIISVFFLFSTDSQAGCPCATQSRSSAQAGKMGIENRVYQIRSEEKPLSASLRIGGLYDSRAGAASSISTGGQADSAIAVNAAGGWQIPLQGDVGLRMDYSGYMDFYDEYDEYDVIDQTVSIEPQYAVGDFLLSLPMGYNYVLEDHETDYDRFGVSPTATYYIAALNQAVAFNGMAAAVRDKDDVDVDEDGDSLGTGAAYLIFLKNKSWIRFSIDYSQTEYDARLADYSTGSTSQNHRKDDVVSTNVDIQYNFIPNVGVFTTYTYSHSSSNVKVYDYDRNIVEAGIALRY
jgi:hypothetical protein